MRLVDRRDFLAAAGSAFAAALAPRAAEAFARTDAVFGAACRKTDGTFGCTVFSERGEMLSIVDLPDRGHDVAFDPASRVAVAFARRPRTFAVAFDPASGRTLHTIAAAENRHFFGHGFFSPDGRLLYATENEVETAAGLIGIYDAASGFERVGEFPTHGMDPHEALLMPDGKTIVVANGGIETHPDYGRQKLNLSAMDSSLAFIDAASGTLIEQHRLPPRLNQLSIRHLAIDAKRRVWFGCQFEGPADDRPQLCGRAAIGEEIALAGIDEDTLGSLSNYIGSVAASSDGARIAMASPKGDTVVILDAHTGRLLSRHDVADGCGLAPCGSGFVATGGRGDMLALPSTRDLNSGSGLSWDNHVLALAT